MLVTSLLLVLAVLGGFLFWPRIMGSLIASAIGSEFGGDARVGSVEYLGDGRFRILDLSLRAPGWPGLAAEVIHVDQVDLDIDRGSLLSGTVNVDNVEMDGLLVRVAELESRPGYVNLASLAPEEADDGGPPFPIPSITIRRGTFEMGLVHDGRYDLKGRRHFSGLVQPDPGRENFLELALAESTPGGDPLPDGLVVTGVFEADGREATARVERFRIDPSIAACFPLSLRLIQEELDLLGEVESASIRLAANEPVDASIRLREVGLTLPLISEGFWSRFTNGEAIPSTQGPRLQVRGGELAMRGWTLAMRKLSGELIGTDEAHPIVGVPFRLELAVEELPKFEWDERDSWMETMVETAPFYAEFELEEFDVEPDADGTVPVVELPTVLARALEKFQLRRWSASVQMLIRRDRPEASTTERAPITVDGQAYINRAAGSFFKFTYPLEDARAYLRFDDRKVSVEYLTAKGSGGSDISLTGAVGPLGRDAGAELRIVGQNVPLDEQLFQALPPGTRKPFDALLDAQAEASLEAAGLLPDDAGIQVARDRRQVVLQRMASLEEVDQTDTGAYRRLKAESAALTRRIEAGPFTLGGRIDLDLTVRRDPRVGAPIHTTGEITIREAGLISDRFPYPVTVVGGRVELTEESILFSDDGLSIVTPGGGYGRLTGVIDMPRVDGRRRVRPDLRVTLLDDVPNPLLYAAIPPTADERAHAAPGTRWPGSMLSRSADLLDEFSLEGTVSTNVDIDTDEEGAITWKAVVNLADGAAAPTPKIGGAMADLGLVWPAGFTIEPLSFVVEVTPRSVILKSLAGRSDEVTITGTGAVDYAPGPTHTDFEFRFGDLPLEEYLLNLVPGRTVQVARDLWEKYQPTGAFDAVVDVTVDGNDSSRITVEATPREIDVDLPNGRTRLIGRGGALELEGDLIRFHDLALEAISGERHDGLIRLNGSYGLATSDVGLAVKGDWTNGAFESGVILEAMELLQLGTQREMYAELAPAGRFDASFHYESPMNGAPSDYSLGMTPKTLDLTIDGTRITTTLGPESTATFEPGRINIDSLSMTVGTALATLNGHVDTNAGVHADLQLDVNSPNGLTPELEAFIPDVLSTAMDAVEFELGGPLDVEDARVTAILADEPGATWGGGFDGQLRFRNAALDAGVDLTEMEGTTTLRASGGAGLPPQLDADVHLDRMLVHGRELTDARSTVHVDDDGSSMLRIPDFIADCGEGGVVARLNVGLRDGLGFRAEVEMADISLERLSLDVRKETAAPPDDATEGQVTGRLDLQGIRGSPAALIGRGAVRVRDARMATMPITLRILQLSHLMLPLNDSLDFADLSFYIDGEQLTFERLLLECGTLRLVGSGGMRIPDMDLAVRFSSRGTVALVSDLVAGVSDHLYAIDVTGPLADPKASVVPLPDVIRPPKTERQVVPFFTAQPPVLMTAEPHE